MRYNVFTFDDTNWLQLTGTAMGAPPAPMYATLYFAIHEIATIKKFPQIQLYRRYIDDVFAIWDGDGQGRFPDFRIAMNSFGKLKWEVSPLSTEVIFLDMTISINGSRICTALYEKPSNLHLFTPGNSCHPPGVLKALVSGTIHRIRKIVSDPTKRQHHLQELYNHLRQRGYTQANLQRAFSEASGPNRLKTIQRSNDPSEILFCHRQFHSHDPKKHQIQAVLRYPILQPPKKVPLDSLRNFRDESLIFRGPLLPILVCQTWGTSSLSDVFEPVLPVASANEAAT